MLVCMGCLDMKCPECNDTGFRPSKRARTMIPCTCKTTTGFYRVVRWCCTSGMCFRCRARGDLSKRVRIVQIENVTEDVAKLHMEGWKSHDTVMERIP